jgi:hypothetical protein
MFAGQIPVEDKKHLLSFSSWDIKLHLDRVDYRLDFLKNI